MFLLFLLIFATFCIKSFENKVETEENYLFFVYDNITLESFCHFSSEVLFCDGKNDTESILNITTFDNVKFYYSILPEILENGKLLKSKEAEVTTLMFFNNSITFIEDETFDYFTSLETLSFRYTNLTEITEKYLTKNLGSHLKYLSFGYNNILFISTSAFQFMTNLFQLGLEGNANVAKFINNGLFLKSLGNLKTLNLFNCNIQTLNDDVFIELKNLELLTLSSNPFISIPKAINKLPNIYYLVFDNTSITSLTFNKEIQNKELQVISMASSKNLISLGNCGFCGFPKLWSITLNCNKKLSKIHENVFGSLEDMPELREIEMEKINKSIIPKSFLKLIFFQMGMLILKSIFQSDVRELIFCIRDYWDFRRSFQS